MSEFLSEDLYGDPQSIQDVVNQLGNVDPNEFYNLQQNLQQLQFLNPSLFGNFPAVNQLSGIPTVNPADPNSYSGMIDGQAIMNQVNQNLAAQGVNNDGLFAGNSEMPPPGDDQQPSDNPGGEDSPFDIVFRSLFGTQGIPDNVDPRILRALAVANETQNDSELSRIKNEIDAAGGYQEWLDSQQEEEVDPNQSTVDGDTTEDDESLVDQVTGAIDDGVDSVINSVQDAVDAAIDALPDSASLEDIMDWIEENVTASIETITPQSIAEEYIGRGVGVNLPTGFPGAGTVFVPGVIPGLPSSSTIIGTVDQILNAPGGVLDQILGRIEGAAEDPLGTLEAVLRGAADEEGNITAGVLNQVIDDILSGSSGTTPPSTQAPSTDEPGTQLGGAGDDTPESATQLVGGVDDEPSPTLGGTGSDTTDDVIGGAVGAALGAAAGGAGGMLANKYRYVPKVKRIDFVDPGMPQVIGGKRQRSSIMGLFEEYL